MYRKPQGCDGCPFQNLSTYFTPDMVIPGAEILLLAQAPGAHEEAGLKIEGSRWENNKKVDITAQVDPQPLIGRTGDFLRKEFWPLTKLKWGNVSRANVLKCRPYNSNELPNIGSNKPANGITITMLKEAIAHCTQHYLHIPESVKHCMAMGEVSLYALSGEELLNYRKSQKIEIDNEVKEVKSTISEWRGWALEYDRFTRNITGGLHNYFDCRISSSDKLIIFPVLHIAALFESDKLYHATLCDFNRFGQLIRAEWPRAVPEIKINYIPESIPGLIGFDTEYTKNKQLIMWSMADAERNVYVIDSKYSRRFNTLPNRVSIVTQNGLVDIPYFMPLIPQGYQGKLTLHDCMLGHALVWAGERTSLDYQLSKVGQYNRHKHLMVGAFNGLRGSQEQAYLYAGLDAETTLNSAWKHLAGQFRADPLVWAEYLERRQPLLYVLHQFQQHGIAIDNERVDLISIMYGEKLAQIQNTVRELTGNPEFNIKSNDDCSRAIYGGIFETPSVKTPRRSAKAGIKYRIEQLKLALGA